jgi:hypothetical protein
MSASLDDYEKSDPNFIADLRASKESVRAAAEWLGAMGYPVRVMPTRERPSVREMREYSDSGDLEVTQRVEVKRRPGMTLSKAEDFPYPSIFVDVCHTFDNAHPKPYAYIVMDCDMAAGFVIYVKQTFRSWVKTRRYDAAKGRHRNFYECPVSLAEFVRFGRRSNEVPANVEPQGAVR